MYLPTPSPEHVASFKKILAEEFGIEVDDTEALRLATNLLQIYFLLPYAKKHVRPPDDKRVVPPQTPSTL